MKLKENWKKPCLISVWVLAGLSWVALGIVLLMDVDRSALIYAATATAVLTEVAIWLTAAIMGVAVYEARRTIMGKVKGIFSA